MSAMPTESKHKTSPPAFASLRRNFSWTLVGNLVYAAAQWGMLTAMAKLGTPEMVGQFALALALTTPVFAFSNLQLRGIQATDAKATYQFNDYLALRMVCTTAAVCFIAATAAVLDSSMETKIVILVVGIGKAFDALSDVYHGFLQQAEEMDRIAKSMMLNGVGSLIVLGAALVLTGDLVLGVTASAIVSVVTLLGVVIPMTASMVAARPGLRNEGYVDRALHLRPRWSRETMLRLTRLAAPLGLVMLLLALNTNTPRYFVEHVLGERELGIFAALAYVLVAGSTVVNALGASASPRLGQFLAARKMAAFRSLLMRLVAIGLAGGLVGAVIALVAGREILTLLYTAEYGEFVDVMVILAIAGGLTFAGSFLGNGMTAARKFSAQVPLFSAVVAVTAVVSAALVPQFGLTGAAWAMVAGGATQVVGSLIVLWSTLTREARS